ncbi:2',3'-cyclic-nucleotide 3'-phosphodiesterase [Stigmatopora nigra]
MEQENNKEVSGMLENPQPEVVAAIVEESTRLENLAAAVEEKKQLAVNGSGDWAPSGVAPVQEDSPPEAPAAEQPMPCATPEEPEKEKDPEPLLSATEEALTQQTEEPKPPTPEKAQEEVEAPKGVEQIPAQNSGEKTEAPAEVTAEMDKQVEAAAAQPEKQCEPEKSGEAAEVTAPTAGSLSFALLQDDKTKEALRSSRTLVVIRGLPGSGKTFLSRALANTYGDSCSVFCADDYVASADSDAREALDQAVGACCADAVSPLVVVDDGNRARERLARLAQLAREHGMVAIFLEPRTEWSGDVAQLAKLSGRKPSAVTAMKRQLDETRLPLFFGWFLMASGRDRLKSAGADFLMALDAFKKNAVGSSVSEGQEVPLEQYFKSKGSLHCTTKFCDYGKAEGAKEYAEKPEVSEFYSSAFDLSVSALFVTPRTFGARVSLAENQLLLWPADAEKEAETSVTGATTLPAGSRAHVTLGCAAGVEAVQTGLDLLEILVLPQVEPITDWELGSLRFYGEGRWMLELKEPLCLPACFSSSYKSGQGKKETKKKKNCAIL